MTKVHRITLLVVDDDDIGAEELGKILERQRYPNHCMSPRVLATETREVEWSDEHPLNNAGWKQAAQELFTSRPAGSYCLRCGGVSIPASRHPRARSRCP